MYRAVFPELLPRSFLAGRKNRNTGPVPGKNARFSVYGFNKIGRDRQP
jgi:hypothetical protein